MTIEIKENNLRNETGSYQNVVCAILEFIESYLKEKGTEFPEDGKILVYISSVSKVSFVFENTSKLVEAKFRVALNQFYKL